MPDTFYHDLLMIAARDVHPDTLDRDRKSLLELAARAVATGDIAALLWLYDDGPSTVELRLSYAFDPAEDAVRPDHLRRIVLPVSPVLPDLSKAPMDRVRDWYRSNHPGIEPRHQWRAIQSGSELIGQVLLLCPELKKIDQDRLDLVLQVFAGTILAERTARPDQAVLAFQGKVAGITEPGRHFDALAEVVRKFTGAEFAIIYRPIGAEIGQELAVAGMAGPVRKPSSLRKTLAVPHDSLTYWAFLSDEIIRLSDITDTEEVARKCGRPSNAPMLDRLHKNVGEVKAWMTGAVRVESLRGYRWGILQIKVLNKSGRYYLHDAFTRTDMRILAKLIDYVARYLPSLETQLTVTDVTEQMTSWNDEVMYHSRVIADRVRDAVGGHISGVRAICFQMTGLPALTSHGGEVLQDLPWKQMEFKKPYQLANAGGDCALTIPIGIGTMLVQLAKSDMPLYEFQILCKVAAAVIGLVQFVAGYRAAGQRLVEVRHAVRSTGQAMLGSSLQALKTFRMAQERPDLAGRELLEGRNFGRNLEISARSSALMVELLEETRWVDGADYGVLNLQSYSLAGLVEEVAFFANLQAVARRIRIEFVKEILPKADMVVCDRPAMLLALFNIIENAVRYSLKGQVVSITAQIRNGRWSVAVANTGMYIPPQKRKAIFRPYQRYVPSDPELAERFDLKPGTGLGLAICQRIVHAHDNSGTIEVSSTLHRDAGAAETVFTLSLPVLLRVSDEA